jgi:outer membrane lipoprotein carrier protein
VLLATLCIAAPTSAAVDQAMLDRVDGAAKATRTLSAQFTQKNRMKLFQKELCSQGRLYFKAPRQIRWEYTSPDPSVLVLDGSKATMRSPGADAQVFDLDKDATLRAVFDQLLTFVGGGSIAGARAGYAIETRGGGVVLVPHADTAVAKTFSRIELQLDKHDQVRGIHLVEKNGDEKDITFTKIDRNGTLPGDAFSP